MSAPPPKQPFATREQVGTLLFVLLCGGPALEMNGFGFGIPFTFRSAIACAAVGGLLGGYLMCSQPMLAGLIGGLAAGPLSMVAVYFYTQHRVKVGNAELLAVQAAACLPGLGIGQLLKKILTRPDSDDQGLDPVTTEDSTNPYQSPRHSGPR